MLDEHTQIVLLETTKKEKKGKNATGFGLEKAMLIKLLETDGGEVGPNFLVRIFGRTICVCKTNASGFVL